MKQFALVLIAILLSGCSSSQPKLDKDLFAEATILAKAGKFRRVGYPAWQMKGYDCYEITVIKPHLGTGWAPVARVLFKSDREDQSTSISLSKANNGSSPLELGYSEQDGKARKRKTLASGIDYGEPVRVKVYFPDQNTFVISTENTSYTKKIAFSPSKLELFASSSVSNIKVLNPSGCKW